jgi:hypothetical protein
MSEPNPYESPRSEKPKLSAATRWLGFGTLLILAPIAAAITFFVTCSVTIQLEAWKMSLPDRADILFLFGPPGLVFIAFLYWASKLRENKDSSQPAETMTPHKGG